MEYSHAFFLFVAGLKLADALTVIGVWFLCWYLRFHSALIPVTKGFPDFSDYSRAAGPLALVLCAVFHMVGAYRRDRIHFGFRSLKKIVQGSVLGTLVFISILYFLGQVNYSRAYLLLFVAVVIAGLVVERALLAGVWKVVERHWVRRFRILLVGEGELLDMYLGKLEHRQPYPIEWVGRLGAPGHSGRFADSVPYLGTEEELEEHLDSKRPDMVVVSYSSPRSHHYAPVLERLSNELVDVKVLPDFGRYSTFTYRAEDECGMPLLHFNQAPTGSTDRVLKRVLDIVGSLAFLIVCSPVYLAIAIAIKLTSRGPVFYSQERMGADGKLFMLFKFRSMRVDAEAETGAVWAKEGDPRTTPLGKWLRKTSLDEIPQFYNVLRGDMSLVGPRPERPVFVHQFRKEIPKYMLRHKMKSGITGWAQVNGWRGNTSIEERIKHDLYYIGHWSHRFDIKILCLTLVKGFVNRHAY